MFIHKLMYAQSIEILLLPYFIGAWAQIFCQSLAFFHKWQVLVSYVRPSPRSLTEKLLVASHSEKILVSHLGEGYLYESLLAVLTFLYLVSVLVQWHHQRFWFALSHQIVETIQLLSKDANCVQVVLKLCWDKARSHHIHQECNLFII